MNTLLYEVKGAVAQITLNRPDRMNTLGGGMKDDLAHAFLTLVRNDPAIRCVVLTGHGDRSFCAGADIKERSAHVPTPNDYYRAHRETHELFSAIEQLHQPIVAAINGVALGGGLELALCCDLRIASAGARFGLPEVKLGVIPAAGGTQRLPRAIGTARAKELMYTCELIDAEHAARIGLISRVVPHAELAGAALDLAQRIAAQPPLAIQAVKRAVDLGTQVSLAAGLEYERYAASMIVDSDDRKEGMRAFLEKRTPNFTGR
jgi:enoyl-CoA hydratase